MSDLDRTLEFGCVGQDVKELQYIMSLEETGIFDKTMKQKVEDFQIKSGEDVTGKITPKGYYKLVHYFISSCTDESLDKLEEENKNNNNE